MIIYYDNSNQFILTEEEFKQALPVFEQGKNVWIERLQVHLTPYYKWAGQKPADPNRRLLNDGGYAIKKFGEWYSEKQPDIKIDVRYYPELLKDIDVEEVKKIEG